MKRKPGTIWLRFTAVLWILNACAADGSISYIWITVTILKNTEDLHVKIATSDSGTSAIRSKDWSVHWSTLKRQMDAATKESLKKLWDANAYPSTTPLYKLAQRRGLSVRVKDVDDWLKDRASTLLLQQRKEPYAVAGTFDNATKPLERVYLDLWDRSTHTSPDGYNYFMIALDYLMIAL